MTARLVLVVPADVLKPTGGNRYDRSLAAALRELGTEVEQRLAPGDWPVATATDRDRLAQLVHAPDPVLVDGLVACGAPGAVARAVAGGCRVHVLVHMPLALEPRPGRPAADLQALEREALHAATGIVTTSRWTAAHLHDRHGLDGVAIAPPGADPAPASAGSSPPRLLQLGAVTPVKDQLTVVDALARVRDLAWTADLTGPLDVDPAYTARVTAALDRHRLLDRVRLTGPVAGAGLQQAWDAADLLLLPSRAETWGMAVTEGLARGVPAVVSLGTGAQEALGRAPDGSVPGAAVPAGDPDALAAAIRDLLGPGRERARRAARARRRTLRSWQHTARDVLAAVS
jgi:glycosyltransferase involved in cell wall biosynthesis